MSHIMKFASTLACVALLTVTTVSYSTPANAGDVLGGIGQLTKGFKYLSKKDKSKCLEDNPALKDLPAGDLAKECKKSKKAGEKLGDAATSE